MPFLAVLALCAAPALPRDDGSLEGFLRRTRERRDAAQAVLREPVQKLVLRLEEPGLATRPSDLARLRTELDALGPEAAELLLPAVDPGEPPRPEAVLRAREVTAALVRLKPAGLRDALVERARAGAPLARANAIQVLAVVPESASAQPALLDLTRSSEPEVRCQALAALSTQSGSEVLPALCGALSDREPAVVREALRVLARTQRADAAPAVTGLTKTPAQAAPFAPEILDFFLALPRVVDDEALTGLLGLARADAVKEDVRVRVLEAFPRFDAARDGKRRKELEPFFSYTNAAVREAALAAAILLGDHGARRELLAPYDQVVAGNADWPEGYERRAAVEMRIEDYPTAIRDLRRAIELVSARAGQGVYRKLWIELARAYLRSGKLPKAVDTLEELGITEALKSEIGADPDFAALRDHPRFKKIFQ